MHTRTEKEMLPQCNLLSRATVGIRHFLLDKNNVPREAICEQLKHLLFCFHAHFMLIYQDKCINIIANKSTTLSLDACEVKVVFPPCSVNVV